MFYTLGTAAKATGKTKTAIAEAIKKGRLSAIKNDLGRYQIDPAELHRVYPPVSEQDGKDDQQTEHGETQELTSKIMVLEAQLKAATELRDQIAAERDDFRRRLDRAEDERRDTLAKLTALLTDQRAKPETCRPWWRRFF